MTYKKQEKRKQSLISIQSTREVEPTVVSLVLKNSDYYKRLSNRFLGGSSLTKANYGQGPLGYEGSINKNQTIFGGVNKADKGRYVFVFYGKAGVSQLASALNDDQYADIWPNTNFLRVEAELAVPFSKEMETNLLVESPFKGSDDEKIEASLKELALNLTELKEYRPKAYYSSQKKALVLGTSSSILLTIGVEISLNRSQHKVVVKTSFGNASASNIYAAIINSNAKTFEPVLAMSIIKMLSFIEIHPIMKAVYELCNSYKDSSVLLTRRERDKVKLNSKINYFRAGLNSMFKHIEKLPTNEAEQYAIVLEPFIQDLIEVSKTNDPAKKALNVLVEGLKSVKVSKEGGKA